MVKGGKLTRNGKSWVLILTFEKDTPIKKETGKEIGIDIGIKKLMVDSNSNQYGKDIEGLMDKIQKKRQDSKAFKRSLRQRNEYINKIIKELPFADTKTVVMENIKNIKRNTKKDRKLRKEFRSKFQRWVYALLFSRIRQLCELYGVHFHTVDPAFTSITCSRCGFIHTLNRRNEDFLCRKCGYTLDADYNASKNILKLYLAQQFMVAGRMQGNV